MKSYAEYVKRLADLMEQSTDGRRAMSPDRLDAALDGEPARVLREKVSLELRRRDGAFFTGSSLAERVVSELEGRLSKTSVIADPACGAGDLLIACAKYLPRRSSLLDTLSIWGECIRGNDIHPEFVELTKIRLVLKALSLCKQRTLIRRSAANLNFTNVTLGDGTANTSNLVECTHVVTNPPFSMIESSPSCEWSSGLVNAAAVFLDVITDSVRPETRVLAVIPDVLRSGSRYERWRKLITSRLRDIQVTLLGRFSRHADVDVVLLKGRKRASVRTLYARPDFVRAVSTPGLTIHDKFFVQVGPVVPHRHEQDGPSYPYITARECTPWDVVEQFKCFRNFAGRVFRPPFVALRRTSRPNDRFRATASIIAGDREVAVENHLVVLSPRKGTIEECRQLLTLLRSDKTNDWLNSRMCCRHLTIAAVKAIPWSIEAA